MVYICEDDNGSTIYEAKLHNPIKNIVKIATNVNCQIMNGLVYVFGNSLIYFYVLEKKNSPNIDIKALSSNKKVTDSLATLELPVERKVAGYQRKHIKIIRKGKLESKGNDVSKFPGRGTLSFSNC